MEKTILVIDDDVDFQFMIGSMLRSSGYAVKTLLEGNLSTVLGSARKCDIVVLDIELPGVNGVELGRTLRAAPETSAIPIILVSGHSQASDIFLQSEANAFIQKPFSFAKLMDKINELVVVA